ncbi:Transcriptional regulator of acetoin/glycerol metabolism [Jatrophihabitans endophyticus]|uniref:Transcriptional regulator of acetoin/glycerol metabolism n=1 Tax=Jatrophihabitans endophyticus TaxID=1206085 RepID=A0A1M5K7M4_9ACTN|nr:helix-turn-helix domain-containing protein [Jatrophihabitans endophyticus]SHG48774.1 Transcriptional regulator of acetoin/glycerol metabolism [Jatrophihabitans endophyticus]
MAPTAPGHQLVLPDGVDVAVHRLRFLTAERADPDRVRRTILASWHRSKAAHVAADRVQPTFQRDPDVDSVLSRSAEPILRRLHDELAEQPVSIVLTDPSGLVLSRRTGDAALERRLDRVLLAPGFSYAEEFVGTNGIGTALEVGCATEVFGHEHYAEDLETLACAGAPVHDPINGRLLGVVDLTCWRRDAQSLLLALAKSTAAQIQQALLTASGSTEVEVLQAYRQTCRRTTGVVFAVTSDAVLLNAQARAELEPVDQNALVGHAVETAAQLRPGRRRSLAVTLPTGAEARMFCQQIGVGDESVGIVVHVKLRAAAADGSDRAGGDRAMLLPGLVGGAALWQRACRQVESAAAGWLVVEGEAGVGKSALLRAVQLREHPARRTVSLDARDARRDRRWLAGVRSATVDAERLVLAHVDELDAPGTRALAAVLQDVKDARPDLVVAATMHVGSGSGRALGQLLALFPTTVRVPALRLRLEDVPALVSFFLGKLGKGARISCSPEAMRVLLRSTWPGNVAQLQQLLHDVVQRRRSGVITLDDLPPEMHSITRRVLSTLESIERDAIIESLADAKGNKLQAAQALGMSRATIYRKIREFGIVSPSYRHTDPR